MLVGRTVLASASTKISKITGPPPRAKRPTPAYVVSEDLLRSGPFHVRRVGAAQLSSHRDGILLTELGPGRERLREALRPERPAYLGLELVVARPQHRPWTKADPLTQALGGARQPGRAHGIARGERHPGELGKDQTDVAAVARGQAQCQALVEQRPSFLQPA